MIDKNSSGAGGVVPYLPLPELRTAPPAGGPQPPRTLPGQTPPAAGATR
jgi:membrane protease subunit HflK